MAFKLNPLLGELCDSRLKNPVLQRVDDIIKGIRSQPQLVVGILLNEPDHDPLTEALYFIHDWHVVAITSDQDRDVVIAPKRVAEHVFG